MRRRDLDPVHLHCAPGGQQGGLHATADVTGGERDDRPVALKHLRDDGGRRIPQAGPNRRPRRSMARERGASLHREPTPHRFQPLHEVTTATDTQWAQSPFAQTANGFVGGGALVYPDGPRQCGIELTTRGLRIATDTLSSRSTGCSTIAPPVPPQRCQQRPSPVRRACGSLLQDACAEYRWTSQLVLSSATP